MMKTLIITGASRGIGAATARLAAENGYAVAVNYNRNQAAALSVVEDIHSAGGTAEAICADISTEKGVLHLFSETDRLLQGQLAGLVNNAGILETQMRLEDMDIKRLERIFTANITGQFLCAREAVKRMSTRHGGSGGSIVNVSSLAAKTGAPNEYLDYAASKAALDALTIGLSKEVAAEGIRVNGVRPAFIYTDIHADGGEPGRVDRIKESIPMKRGGTPQEVAEAIVWLLSDKASYTTGSFIDLAGGR
ncbi:NAD(P)-dependent dehydrogenase (short-subunit alcohol dehydrogenase family) [Pedobacter sp. AK017]|uniref:SDR family oxidoreductase n=1 Tax=Pedobacter sp. AK017 TaxID=2723073 RepID=UPI00161B5FD2|nr:SDR family oxidoreductase [Pedobacter sp. AK017]MBB5438335.1 NAD(P)-dependent dehydrogenase (short-subunit alcohol dehydrogenase family) [Pedobacter sp. AK017]